MASIFTTPDMQAAAKSFMHDVLVAAGRINSQRQSSTRVFTYPNEVKAAQVISDELINREFKNIDSGISRLSGESFAATINGDGWKRFKSEQIAKAIVYFAELNNMYMTGKDIDAVIKRLSYTISEGINRALEH
jgi:hypothetical protein